MCKTFMFGAMKPVSLLFGQTMYCNLCPDFSIIHLTKFPTLPVIFSIYLKTDVLDFFDILWLSRTINLQNACQFSVESACKICRNSILIIRGVILKVAKMIKTQCVVVRGNLNTLRYSKCSLQSAYPTYKTMEG